MSHSRPGPLVTAAMLAACLPALASPLVTAAAADSGQDGRLQLSRPVASPPSGRALTATERALSRRGLLVPHPRAYARAKALAARHAGGQPGTLTAASLTAPAKIAGFAGLTDSNSTPSDSTGAIGTDRYIELVNVKYGIYNRNHAVVAQGNLHSLVGASRADNVFDPQIIWDPGTKRFYFAADRITSSGRNLLAIGFSKTASPSGPADFCKYTLNYGFRDFPDYPKLGDTKNFWLIGVNVFSPDVYSGSDLIAITKPRTGTGCPGPDSFGVTRKADLKNPNGTRAFTPVPANQIDTRRTGWVVARPARLPASSLTVFKVTRNRTTGNAVISAGRRVDVAPYTVPANAPQRGTNRMLDTSDTRLTQAVSAVDPAHGGKVGLWTQHTTAGGVGAQVRWYEINPATTNLLQTGIVTDGRRYVFNGAVSPDRKVRGKVHAFGGNMVLNFNTSSARTFPAIKVVSKVGAGPQSAPVTVITSKGPHIDFACNGSSGGRVCRWGDYAAATPDPAAPATAAKGVVYGTSQYTKDGRVRPNFGNWLTRNFVFRP